MSLDAVEQPRLSLADAVYELTSALRPHQISACVLFALAVLGGNIAARLADLRQHLGGHPSFELAGLWQLRRKNQRVETRLVDDDGSGFVGSVANRDGR